MNAPAIQPVKDLVAVMGAFGALRIGEHDAVARALDTGDATWAPRPHETPRRELERLMRRLPGRLPALFETLLLSHRFADVDLGRFVLRANPPGRTLGGWHGILRRSPPLLAKAALVPFARSREGDPICFALARRRPGGDCPVVQLDAADLARGRTRVVRELAPTFQQLVEDVVADAARMQRLVAGAEAADRSRGRGRRR